MKRIAILSVGVLMTVMAAHAQKPAEVLAVAQRTNNYFMAKYSDPTVPTFVKKMRTSNLWTRAVYYEGLMALHEIDADKRYLDYTDRWADFHKWTARNSIQTTNADDQCCEQTYIDRSVMAGRVEWMAPTKVNLDHQMGLGKYDDWWWIDAIQMAMPIYAKYYKATGERRYIDFAMRSYRCTRDTLAGGLFNKTEGLWWRDKNYKAPYKEPDGKNCYWSRGNGWVYGALVRVMQNLSPKDRYYKELKADFVKMSEALLKVQRPDGFWNASLVSTNYEGPEVTGTSLFLYGMSWGINHGVLNAKKYRAACDSAWKAMAGSVHADGFLGWNQGTGADPSTGQPVTYTSVPDFEDYGTGCFLLGAAEYYRLLGLCVQ